MAVISPGQSTYSPSSTVTFDGSGSHDPNPGGSIASFQWSVVANPVGSTAAFYVTTGAQAALFVDAAGDYTIQLTVVDTLGLSGQTQYSFTTTPFQGIRLVLAWPTQYTRADMDLHLVNLSQDPAEAMLFGTGGCAEPGSTIATDVGCDCDYATCLIASNGVQLPQPYVLDWYYPNVKADNPVLDVDNVNISVPETITISGPRPGRYEAFVHYYSAEGRPSIPVDTSVSVYLGSTLAWTGRQHFDTINQLWAAGTVTVPSNGSTSFTPMASSSTGTSNLTLCKQPNGSLCS